MSDAALPRRMRDRDRLAVAGASDLRAFARAGRHTGRVRVMKRGILIFCTATVSLGAIIIFFDPFSRIGNFSLGGVGIHGTQITIDTPRLTGKRKNGLPYEVRAAQGIQDIRTPDVVELVQLDAKVEMRPSSWVNLTAGHGLYNSAKDELQLSGPVRIRSDVGYDMKTQSARVEFRSGLMQASEPVKVMLKAAGSIDADGMRILESGQQVVFEGNVHSVILPEEEQRAEAAGLQKGTTQ
jgi:lipopolysaccharide export system protein LptC